jgi:hypothetical protein
LSGGKRRGGLGDFREGLTDGIDEEGWSEFEEGWRRRWCFGAHGRCRPGDLPVVLQRRGQPVDVQYDKVKLVAVSTSFGDASMRRIGRPTPAAACVSGLADGDGAQRQGEAEQGTQGPTAALFLGARVRALAWHARRGVAPAPRTLLCLA